MGTPTSLDLTADVRDLTAALVDVESVSGDEQRLADLVEDGLRRCRHLEVVRDGNAVLARTRLGRPGRVLLAGHLDTVPIADNLPSRREGDVLHGCGAADMKSGDAVILRLAATLTEPRLDVTYVLYDCEEVEATRNGLGRLVRSRPDWLEGDLAILMEGTSGMVEGGCQGTLRVEVDVPGRRAHSARSWLGTNAIHAAQPLLQRLADYRPREVDIDGLVYREGIQAVRFHAGVANNVVPDLATVTVNFRFAPDRSPEQALEHLRAVVDPQGALVVRVTDCSPGALPGLDRPAAAEFVAVVGTEPAPKYGWTDVARFSELGIPALNYGPGDPAYAHTREEHVLLHRVVECERVLREWLSD